MRSRIPLIAIAGLAMLMSFVASASAENKTFSNPMQAGNRLDWCFNWGVGCGSQAATAWCKAQGWANGAVSFSEATDIGATTPTRLFGTGAVCDQAFCDGFSQITCSRPNAQTFNNPMQGSNRLDWCYSWGTGCGAVAANAWCKAHGFSSASAFSEAVDIGASSPTRLISTGAVCDQGFCDGFAAITCQP
jgi:hypothetical protein